MCTNTDGSSSVEYTEKTMSVKGHMVEEYQDKTATALCSCLLSNLSTEETVAVQVSSDDTETGAVEGGWYVYIISGVNIYMYMYLL